MRKNEIKNEYMEMIQENKRRIELHRLPINNGLQCGTQIQCIHMEYFFIYYLSAFLVIAIPSQFIYHLITICGCIGIGNEIVIVCICKLNAISGIIARTIAE